MKPTEKIEAMRDYANFIEARCKDSRNHNWGDKADALMELAGIVETGHLYGSSFEDRDLDNIPPPPSTSSVRIKDMSGKVWNVLKRVFDTRLGDCPECLTVLPDCWVYIKQEPDESAGGVRRSVVVECPDQDRKAITGVIGKDGLLDDLR